MQLSNLSIFRNGSYFNATVTFQGEYGEVKLQLDKKMSDEVVQVCADAIIRASRTVAERMTEATIQDITPALADQSEELEPDDEIPY